jgi:hypothetical protein
MGYGHQRSAYPLRNLAPDGKIVNANDYPRIPEQDRSLWAKSRAFYEFVSKFEQVPLVGKAAFGLFDQFQKILSFYPRRAAIAPNFALRQNFKLIRRGWGEHLIKTLSERPLPFLTTFFASAFMAEFFRYPGEIYCVICDADVSRAWAAPDASQSRINYFAPNARVMDRLLRYGVPRERIMVTGFPLPKENLGSLRLEIARRDLGHRLLNLDPKRTYCAQYAALIREYVGSPPKRPDHPLTILFSVGGAGAQKDVALTAIRSLADKIQRGALRFLVGAGSRPEVRAYFEDGIARLGIRNGVEIISHHETVEYFGAFNGALRTTDILWTKPSELSFYAGLGIPIVIAPPLGSHEEFNRDWLLTLGVGLKQEDPRYADEWLFDYLEAGWFAEAAMEGFVEVEKRGTFVIEDIIRHGLARR